ncbi:GTPase obg [Desulfamplus magnetovallimortis]|uniref:GTPase Obg n=1 Tax=Desulfamplus magnetovallimortis TaxID=1246637 RepID=A0A1W1H9E4_9BACT|nr:GTPase ObgE [Desulfamplus magnetovallimortis]SLM29073.1 GTPase obg [Desulfamplus magnetovallimortis]
MKFIDEAIITVLSGKGGPGCVSFRRERFIEKGGPNGGDGGDGGSVIFKTVSSKRTLFDVRRQKFIRAANGAPGEGSNRHGRNGEDRIVELPAGTLITDADTGDVIADLTQPGQEFIVAKGGIGGRGNKRFTTSTNRAPRYAQPGMPGVELNLKLELKLIADVGIVGLPNAGKSTLISVISSARPKIADYPFTTLTPSIGMVQPDFGEPFAVADIPGLIEGAHEGTGLGVRFLKHVERTGILLHLIDVSKVNPESPLDDFNLINRELSLYSPLLAKKKQIVVLNKTDISDTESKVKAFIHAYTTAKYCDSPKSSQLDSTETKDSETTNSDILAISAATGKGTRKLVAELARRIASQPDISPKTDS